MDVEPTSAAAPSQGAAARRPIGEFLVERGLVSEEQLKQALAEQRSSGKRLGEILVERGAITRMALASVLGEQWEEAGRHLRAVVPVRLAGGKEADAGLAGGEELTDSLASLQAAVARLEDLSGGPGSERVIVGDEAIEASLGALARQLAELQAAVAAPVVVETDHLGDRLAELDAFLRGRDEHVDARLTELAVAASRVPAVEPDPAIGERLDRIDAWLREAPTGVDPEVAERLGRVEALLIEQAGAADAVSPELVRRLDEIEAAAKRERPAVDLAPIEQRLDALDASVAEALTAPVADAPTEALVVRLEALERSLGAVRSAVEAPRDDSLGEALLERFGRLEESVREAVARPASDSVRVSDELVGRLDELRAAVASQTDTDRLAGLERALAEVRGALESPRDDGVAERLGAVEQAIGGRDLAWEAAVERLGRLEESVREAVARPASESAPVSDELVGRLDELRAAVASQTDTDRLAGLERALAEVRGALESPRDDGVAERLGAVEQAIGGRDLAWEAAVERLGRLEESVREALARREADDVLGDDLLARLEALQSVVAGLEGSAGAARSAELAERFGSLEASLETVLRAVDSPREDGIAERLGRLEESLRAALDTRPDDDRLELIERSLHELRSLLESTRDESERLAGFEHALHELRAAVQSSRDDGLLERLGSIEGALGGRDLAWEAVAQRLGRLEETIGETTAPREDGRLDEVLTRLGELGEVLTAPDHDPVLRRLDGLEHTIREATTPHEDGRLDEVLARLGELRQTVETPRDDALLHRFDALEHTIRDAAAPREDGRLDEALARLEALRGELASAHETRLGVDDIRALLDEHREAADRSDRSGETIGLLRKLARESAESSEALAERLGAALAEGFAELRAAVEQPRDGALHERLDRIDAALQQPEAAEPPGARFLERLVARSHNQIAERIGELERAFQAPDTDTASLAERDARIAELVEQLNARPVETAVPAADRPSPGDTTSFLALVPASDGYRLVALEGALPAAGEGLTVPDDDRALVVARLGRSPYPGDARPCAYLQAS